jgi:hypothetical protein
MNINYELYELKTYSLRNLAAKAADFYEGVEHIRFRVIRNEVAKFHNKK